MSGHSKWSKIKRQKAVTDAKKGALFTKHSRAITIAAKEGGNPDLNFKLRLAIDAAKSAGVPKDTIERAIKKGTGEDKEGVQLEEVIYEGFGPSGIAVLISVVTDNKNRTVSNIKHILNKYGGSLGGSGSVIWMFERKGVIRIDREKLKDFDVLDFALEVDVEDYKKEDNEIILYTTPEKLQKVQENIKNKKIEIKDAGIEFIAKESVKITDESTKEKLEKLFEELDEDADVSNFYTNAV